MALVSSLSILPTLADDLSMLEEKLQNSVIAEDNYLTEIASHLILAGGKRVRPGFAIASSGVQSPIAKPATTDVLMGGVAVELVPIENRLPRSLLSSPKERLRKVLSCASQPHP